jgi:hypothetical protein
MPNPPDLPDARKPISRGWFFLWGFLAGLIFAATIAGAFLVLKAPIRNLAAAPNPNPTPDVHVTLQVASDGCGVERSEVTGSTPINNLTWVVRDAEGFVVLERSAEGEYRYRYFGNGNFTISINAWYGGRYHQISDEVKIDC